MLTFDSTKLSPNFVLNLNFSESVMIVTRTLKLVFESRPQVLMLFLTDKNNCSVILHLKKQRSISGFKGCRGLVNLKKWNKPKSF